MIPATEVEKAFRTELAVLLDKYGAEIAAEDHYQGWAECGEDIRMTATIPSLYDKDGTPVREYVAIDLGRRIDCDL